MHVTCHRRWGSGPCLTDVIDAFAPGGRAAAQLPLRMPVRDIFRNARGTSLLGGKLEVRHAAIIWYVCSMCPIAMSLEATSVSTVRLSHMPRTLGKPCWTKRTQSFKSLQGGALKAGTRVVVVPSGQAGAVKAVEAGGGGVAFACAGDSVDLSLSGVDTQVRWPVKCFIRI